MKPLTRTQEAGARDLIYAAFERNPALREWWENELRALQTIPVPHGKKYHETLRALRGASAAEPDEADIAGSTAGSTSLQPGTVQTPCPPLAHSGGRARRGGR